MKGKLFRIYLSECIGTGALVLIGLSVVILINGVGSPFREWIPSPGTRRAITGFLFGTTGCLITLSPVGKISGAHINPIVSLAFWMKRKMTAMHTLGFILAQLIGAVVGAFPLLLWGGQGSSVNFGATVPLPDGTTAAFAGEVVTSFLLIAGIFFFTGHHMLRRYTPYLMPFLFCIMVYAEGAISGTSTNPARSLGPAVVSGIWTANWLYWIAPVIGAVIAVGVFEMPLFLKFHIKVPKLYQR